MNSRKYSLERCCMSYFIIISLAHFWRYIPSIDRSIQWWMKTVVLHKTRGIGLFRSQRHWWYIPHPFLYLWICVVLRIRRITTPCFQCGGHRQGASLELFLSRHYWQNLTLWFTLWFNLVFSFTPCKKCFVTDLKSQSKARFIIYDYARLRLTW